jgi:putative SOS response-associated peptidase YedK
MCYGFYPVKGTDGGTDWVDRSELFRLEREGKIIIRKDGFHYAKDTVGVVLFREHEFQASPMRWDLIPRNFLAAEPTLNLSEMIKKKNSRAKNPETGKSWGFDSYNARIESMTTLWSFKQPWKEGLRCVLPAKAFKERPNMDGAPHGFTGKEYEIRLNGTFYLAGLFDTWERKEEKIESCTIITMSSEGNEKIRGIWHERIPIILSEQEALQWLDPKTTPDQALKLCRLMNADNIEIVEVPKQTKKAKPESDQARLEL